MKRLKDGQCIRLYDKDGNHLLSILPCGIENEEAIDYDLVYPKGEVEYCGVDQELVDSLMKVFPVGSVSPDCEEVAYPSEGRVEEITRGKLVMDEDEAAIKQSG